MSVLPPDSLAFALLAAARIDQLALEISIANARRRLAAIEVPPEAE